MLTIDKLVNMYYPQIITLSERFGNYPAEWLKEIELNSESRKGNSSLLAGFILSLSCDFLIYITRKKLMSNLAML